MRTKSIRLTDEEAAELHEYATRTGEVEASVLKRATLRELRQMLLEDGILAYLDTRDSSYAAAIAGVPRAIFLQTLMDNGVTVLDGPSTLTEELRALARRPSDARLAEAVEAAATTGE